MSTARRWALWTLLVLCTALPAAGQVTITRTSSPVFYMDTSSSLFGMYVSYSVTNTSGGTYSDVWVDITSFTGGIVSLAPNETKDYRIGEMAAAETRTVFFYLQASGGTTTGQSHTITAYDGTPSGGTPILSSAFTFTEVDETIAAAANKVTVVVVGPNPPTLGGIVTVTVTGQTGTIGNDRILSYTPAGFLNWPADDYEMVSSEITLTGGNTGVLTDQLYAVVANKSSTDYTAVYTFRATGTTASPTTVSPVGFIASGTQIKHTDTGSFGSFDPIEPAENQVSIAKSASPAYLLTGGTVTYTVTFTSIASLDVQIDQVEDTLPISPGTVVYSTGTTLLDAATYVEPTQSGALLTWSKPFTVPAGGTASLTYDVTIPNTVGDYTNSVISFIGSEQVDASLDTTDPLPATAIVYLYPPTAPDAVDDTALAQENTATTIDVLANDSDVNGDPLTINAVDAVTAQGGSASINNNGTPGDPSDDFIDYTPPASFTGTDTFTYTIDDGTGRSDTATVTVTVNGPPVALPDAPSTTADTATTVDVLDNDSDPDLDPLSISAYDATSTEGGTVTLNDNGTPGDLTDDYLDYTPPGAFTGTDTFTYTVSDGNGGTDTETVTVTVNSVTDLSLAASVDSATPPAGSQITYTITVTNESLSPASTVVVDATLDSGLAFVSDSPSQGSYNSSTGEWTVGTIGASGSATLTLTVTVDSFAAIAQSFEVKSHDGSDTDSTPGNGSTTEDDDDSVSVTPTDTGGQICFLVADSGDNLTKILRSGSAETLVGATGTSNVEASAYWPGTETLYAINASQLGTINTNSGVFTAVGGNIGWADGAAGSVDLNDADGLTFHPHTGVMWATQRRLGVEDLLFQIDPTTGQFIADAFGTGVDYLVVGTIVETGFPDIDDFAIDAIDATFYAIANDGGTGDRLVTIDPTNGAVTDVGALGVNDMEGFAFDGYGVLYGTTGTSDALYTMNKSTGAATSVVALSAGGTDYESISCLTDGVNTITGRVFLDVDGDGVFDVGLDEDASGITVQLYRDVNSDGLVDGGDALLATDDAAGTFGFIIAAEGDFVMQLDTGDLPVDATMTTDNVEAVSFSGFGGTSSAHAFGFKRPADLSVVVTSDVTAPTVGETVVYTIALTNDGPSPATGVSLSDVFPAGLTYVSDAPDQGSYDDATNVWTVGDIPSGTTLNLTITTTANAAGSVSYSAQVSASGTDDSDSTPGNDAPLEDDQDSQDITVNGLPVATDDSASTDVNTAVAVLVLGNDSDPEADPLEISAFDAASTEGGTVALNDNGTPGDTTDDYLDYTPSTGFTGTDTFTYTISDGAGGTDTATVTMSVDPEADLSLTVTVDDPAPTEGTNVTFTLTLANGGPSGATGIELTNSLPVGLTFVSATPSQGTFDSGTGVWTVGSVGSGSNATLDIVATATTTGPLSNEAEVTAATEPDPDSTPGNDTASEDDQDSQDITVNGLPVAVDDSASTDVNTAVAVLVLGNDSDPEADPLEISAFDAASTEGGTVALNDNGTPGDTTDDYLDYTPSTGFTGTDTFTYTISDGAGGTDTATVTMSVDPEADLSLTVTVDDPAPTEGTNVTFTLTLANGGPSGATGIEVTNTLPAGLTFVSATPSQGSFDSGTGVWTVGSVGSGSDATVDIVAAATTTGTLSNEAEVTAAAEPDPDSTPGNDTPAEDDQDWQDITVNGLPVATDDAASTDVNTAVAVLVLGNDSDPESDPLEITAFDAASVEGGTVALNDNGTPGDTTDDYLDYTPANGFTGTDTFTYTISDGAGGTDTATVTVTVDPEADLSLTVTVDDPAPTEGTNVTFTVTLANGGPSGATGVDVTNSLPVGLTFVSATPSQGTFDSGTGVWTVGSVGSGSNATLDIVATATTTGPLSNEAEVTAATEPDPDSTPGNDTASEDDQDSQDITVNGLPVAVDDSASTDVNTAVAVLVLGNDSDPDADPLEISAFDAASTEGGTVALNDNGTPGDTTDDYLDYTPATGFTGTDTFTYTISDGAGGTDTATVTMSVDPEADLSLTVTVDDPAPTEGTNVTFTVTLANGGPSGATGVEVTNTLPAGLTFVSATPSQGTFDSGTGVWTAGSVGSGSDATLDIVATVNTLSAVSDEAEVTAATESDPDSTPNNADQGEDDWDNATVTAVGGSGGGGGGLESNGNLAGTLARVLFERRVQTALSGGVADLPRFQVDPASGKGAATASSALLRSLIPLEGPESSDAYETSPSDLLPVTNAFDVVAADYIRDRDGRRLGAFFGTVTLNAQLYEHTKVVCDRLRGAELINVRTVIVDGQPFLISQLAHESGAMDHAVSFVAYQTPSGFVVESQFSLDAYQTPSDATDVLNIQIWSVSREYTVELLREALARLAEVGPIHYPTKPTVPKLYVRSGNYAQGRLELSIYNGSGAKEIRLTGGTLQRAEGGPRTDFTETVTLPPVDANGVTTVKLPLGPLFDASFFVETDQGDRDLVYLADGAWSYTYDGMQADVSGFQVAPAEPALKVGQYALARNVTMSGEVQTWAVLFRYLQANGRPVDLSGYSYFEFTTSGLGQLRVLFEKESVTTSDHFGTVLSLEPEAKRHRIWFDDLRRPDGTGRLDASDLLMISFYIIGEQGRSRPFELNVSDLRFGGGEGDVLAEIPDAYELTQNFPNPFNPTTRLAFGIPQDAQVTLHVYDMLGRRVATLADGFLMAGRHEVAMDASGLTSGVYLYRLQTGGTSLSRTMTLLR